MEDPVQAFIDGFHNLPGITVNEKRKSLFLLFHRNSNLLQDFEALNSLTAQLSPESHLEKIFYVDFLIYFRRIPELLQQFIQNRDEITIHKLSKQPWFIRAVLTQIQPLFLEQVLPQLSYTLRLKILKKLNLTLNETDADTIFDTILQRYGIFQAANLLTSCSSAKIEQTLKNHPVQLWTSQLKILYDKNPELIRIYFDERSKLKNSTVFDDPIFAYVAAKNPEMFTELRKKFEIRTRLGKRTTKKFVEVQRGEILAEPKSFVSNLNSRKLVRKLGRDFEEVYRKLFPEKVWEIQGSVGARLLKFYVKRGRDRLFLENFNRVFHSLLKEDNEEYMKMLPPNSVERENWARIKVVAGNDECLKYLKPEHCLDIIKSRINSASWSQQRCEYVQILATNCCVYEDWEALATAADFVYSRFKNDNVWVLQSFFNSLIGLQDCHYKSWSEKIWNSFMRLLKQSKLKNYNTYLCQIFIFKYLEFLVQRGDSVKKEMEDFLQSAHYNSLNGIYVCRHNPKLEKAYLSNLIELCPKRTWQPCTVENYDCLLIVLIKDYNRRNSKDPIDIFENPRLAASMKTALIKKMEVEQEALAEAFEFAICNHNKSDKVEELRRLYWEHFDEKVATYATLRWFLHYFPRFIMENFENFAKVFVQPRSKYLRWFNETLKVVKCYSHLKLDSKVIEVLSAKLEEEDYVDKSMLFRPLSLLMAPQDYLKIAETYKPTEEKVDLDNPETKKLFEVQTNSVYWIKNLKSPQIALPLVISFCCGDYLKHSLPSLYSCLYNIPEDEVKRFLDIVENKGAVSVKKHALFLTCFLSTKKIALDAVQRSHLTQSFQAVFKMFKNNPSEDLWQSLVTKFDKLDKNDQWTSHLVVEAAVLPSYKSRYFQIAWRVLDESGNKFKPVLLDKFPKSAIGDLDLPFVSSVLQKDLFETEKINKFFSHFLIRCSDNAKIDLFGEILENFKKNKWNSHRGESRRKLANFITVFANTYLDWKGCNSGLIDAISTKFLQVFSSVEAFEEFIAIALLRLKNQSVEELCGSIIKLNGELVARFGELSVIVYAGVLNRLLEVLLTKEEKRFELYRRLVEAQRCTSDLLFVIKLLPNTKPEVVVSYEYYNETLFLLEKSDSESVQMHLNMYYKL